MPIARAPELTPSSTSTPTSALSLPLISTAPTALVAEIAVHALLTQTLVRPSTTIVTVITLGNSPTDVSSPPSSSSGGGGDVVVPPGPPSTYSQPTGGLAPDQVGAVLGGVFGAVALGILAWCCILGGRRKRILRFSQSGESTVWGRFPTTFFGNRWPNRGSSNSSSGSGGSGRSSSGGSGSSGSSRAREESSSEDEETRAARRTAQWAARAGRPAPGGRGGRGVGARPGQGGVRYAGPPRGVAGGGPMRGAAPAGRGRGAGAPDSYRYPQYPGGPEVIYSRYTLPPQRPMNVQYAAV